MSNSVKINSYIDFYKTGDWGQEAQDQVNTESVFCIRGADINDFNLGMTSTLPQRYIAKKNLKKLLHEGDIIIEISGGSPVQSTGRVAYVRKIDRPIICSNFCKAITVREEDDAKFFFYLLKNIYEKGVFFNFESKTTGIKNLLVDDAFNSIFVPRPCKKDQQKIAFILSSLDAKIELNNRINTELEAMAKALYDYWFVQFDFPDDRGLPYRSSGGRMVWNEELKREVPEGWEVKVLGEAGKIIGGSTPSTANDENFTDRGIPWITPKDLSLNKQNKFIARGETDLTETGFSSANLNILPKGSILLSSRAPIGYMAIAQVELTTNQGFKSFIPGDSYGTEFTYYFIRNLLPVIERNANGSTFKEVSGSVLKSIRCLFPVNELVVQYNSFAKSIFLRQEKLEIENRQLSSLRDWLLPMLMNGQVRVL